MNPILPCPHCGKDTDFHDDEVEQVEEGSAVCVRCGMALEEANLAHEIVSGKHPELVEQIMSNRDEEGEEESEEEEEDS